jgi:hypothetical protein
MSDNVRSLEQPRQHGAFYHFPGGAPEGALCGTCVHFLAARRDGRCQRWAAHRGILADALETRAASGPAVQRGWWRGWPKIPAASDGCKYHEPLPAGATKE